MCWLQNNNLSLSSRSLATFFLATHWICFHSICVNIRPYRKRIDYVYQQSRSDSPHFPRWEITLPQRPPPLPRRTFIIWIRLNIHSCFYNFQMPTKIQQCSYYSWKMVCDSFEFIIDESIADTILNVLYHHPRPKEHISIIFWKISIRVCLCMSLPRKTDRKDFQCNIH